LFSWDGSVVENVDGAPAAVEGSIDAGLAVGVFHAGVVDGLAAFEAEGFSERGSGEHFAAVDVEMAGGGV
jgi:hypothetical protein